MLSDGGVGLFVSFGTGMKNGLKSLSKSWASNSISSSLKQLHNEGSWTEKASRGSINTLTTTQSQLSIVNYRAKKEAGYFISSVFAEKAIDILVCRRQKLRGMNWSRDGADNVLSLRELILNEEWENHWQTQMAA